MPIVVSSEHYVSPVQHTSALAKLLQGLLEWSPAHLAHLFFPGDLILVVLLQCIACEAFGVFEGSHANAERSARTEDQRNASPWSSQFRLRKQNGETHCVCQQRCHP